MGSAKRLRKLYEKPKKLWDSQRIGNERKLLMDYGLKNMRELWRIQTILRAIRREARRLLSGRGADTQARKQQLVERVKRFLVDRQSVSLDDILALSVRDILERRLQTVVFRRGLASSIVQARQFVAHGHVALAGQKNTSPSRLVSFPEEKKIGWYGKPIKFEEAEEAGKEGIVQEKPAEEKTAAEKPAGKIEAVQPAAQAAEAGQPQAPEPSAQAA